MTEELAQEKKQSIKTEELFDNYKEKMTAREAEFNDAAMQLAKVEIENDELKNEVRNLTYMIEDLEQKLDS